MNNRKEKYDLKNNIKLISLVAIFLALSAIFKYLGQLILITGFPVELELIIYIVGLIIIYDYKYKIIFLILAPIIWLLIVPPFAFNILQVFVEYFLPQLFFIIIPLTWTWLNIKSKITLNFGLTFVIIFVYLLKCGLHIIAGFYWWTPGEWFGSFLINARIIGINLVIQLPFSLIIINTIIQGKILPNDILDKIFPENNNANITHVNILKKYMNKFKGVKRDD